MTKELILSLLTKAVNGTDKEFFNEEELNGFAEWFYNRQDGITSGNEIAESFVNYWWNTDKTCRRCSKCGKLMYEGYCVNGGTSYYCSEECLHEDFTDEEWAKECENNDQSYYTEWY